MRITDPQAGTWKLELVVVLFPCGSNLEGSLVSTPVTTAALGYIEFPEVLESLWSVLRRKRWHGLLWGSPLQLAGYVITRHACMQCDWTVTPAPDLKDPCRGWLILPGRLGREENSPYVWSAHLPIYGCLWMIFFSSFIFAWDFSLTSRKCPCCALQSFPCRVTMHLTTSNSIYSSLDLSASALLNFYTNYIIEELIFVDFKFL